MVDGQVMGLLVVILEQDVLGDWLICSVKKCCKVENFLCDIIMLFLGDLVVYVEYGIGCYIGLEIVMVLKVLYDCVVIEYVGGDWLYLLVENIELFSCYGYEEGLLDKLGGGVWQVCKVWLKECIKLIVDKLMCVVVEWLLCFVLVLEFEYYEIESFVVCFFYIEIDDQVIVIVDVVEDLVVGCLMDWLVVGDVGFGKIEVVMCVVFIVVFQGWQVVVVVLMMLLVCQYYCIFVDCFWGMVINVWFLLWFVFVKEVIEICKGLVDGSVDIVVGIYVVLVKQVWFKNFGLLIVDEEQYFGVGYKECLKELCSDIYVLMLIVMLILCILQLLLIGVCDLLIIGMLLVDWLVICIYVLEFDSVIICEVLLCEKYCGG